MHMMWDSFACHVWVRVGRTQTQGIDPRRRVSMQKFGEHADVHVWGDALTGKRGCRNERGGVYRALEAGVLGEELAGLHSEPVVGRGDWGYQPDGKWGTEKERERSNRSAEEHAKTGRVGYHGHASHCFVQTPPLCDKMGSGCVGVGGRPRYLVWSWRMSPRRLLQLRRQSCEMQTECGKSTGGRAPHGTRGASKCDPKRRPKILGLPLSKEGPVWASATHLDRLALPGVIKRHARSHGRGPDAPGGHQRDHQSRRRKFRAVHGVLGVDDNLTKVTSHRSQVSKVTGQRSQTTLNKYDDDDDDID